MTSLVVGDLILESLTPSVNAPLPENIGGKPMRIRDHTYHRREVPAYKKPLKCRCKTLLVGHKVPLSLLPPHDLNRFRTMITLVSLTLGKAH
jgi:hypothetical protein